MRHRWRKRIWSCPDPDCEKKTWTEQSWLCRPRKVLTERARAEICRAVGQDISSVSREARRFGVGWHCAHQAVQDVGRPLVEDRARTEGVSQVGLDETVYLHARRRRRRVLVTGVVDVESGRLLDVFEGREASDLRRWMRSMPTEWLDRIEVVSVDPHEGYRSAIVKPDPQTGAVSTWAKATIVVDPFHVVRLGNEAVTKCRQRVQQRSSVTGAGRAIRSTAPAGFCSWAQSASTTGAGNASTRPYASVTLKTRSSTPGWPRRRSAASI